MVLRERFSTWQRCGGRSMAGALRSACATESREPSNGTALTGKDISNPESTIRWLLSDEPADFYTCYKTDRNNPAPRRLWKNLLTWIHPCGLASFPTRRPCRPSGQVGYVRR